MILQSGYTTKGRSDVPDSAEYRPMTIAEAKMLTYGDHIHVVDCAGKVRMVKVNGAPKTWKRDPGRVEVPFKYGMYEYGTLRSGRDGTLDGAVVPV